MYTVSVSTLSKIGYLFHKKCGYFKSTKFGSQIFFYFSHVCSRDALQKHKIQKLQSNLRLLKKNFRKIDIIDSYLLSYTE